MDIVLRASAMFVIIFVILRLLGKRELSQLAPFEIVTLVVLGDLIQQSITHNDFSLTGAMLAICTFAFWSVVLGWIVYLFPSTQRVLEGSPRVIVRDGEILSANLRRDRITRAEIESEMRLAGIATLQDVAWAILEPQGKISFIGRQPDVEPARQRDESDAGR